MLKKLGFGFLALLDKLNSHSRKYAFTNNIEKISLKMKHFTVKVYKHIPSLFSFKWLSSNDVYFMPLFATNCLLNFKIFNNFQLTLTLEMYTGNVQLNEK